MCWARSYPIRAQGRMLQREDSSALIEEVVTMKAVKSKLTMPLLLANLAISLVSGASEGRPYLCTLQNHTY